MYHRTVDLALHLTRENNRPKQQGGTQGEDLRSLT
jgi:hypothetical protein